jgi:hypothetical protein
MSAGRFSLNLLLGALLLCTIYPIDCLHERNRQLLAASNGETEIFFCKNRPETRLHGEERIGWNMRQDVRWGGSGASKSQSRVRVMQRGGSLSLVLISRGAHVNLIMN